MTVDAPSIRTENIRYFPKKGKTPKKREFFVNIPLILNVNPKYPF